jgi:hypothetical protein
MENQTALLADDLIFGAASIASYIGLPARKVFYLHEIGALPTFKLGGTIAARKSEINQRLSATAA